MGTKSSFKPGDLVELSSEGWAQGLAVHYAYTVGEVVSYDCGILIVLRDGTSTPMAFLDRFWEKVSKEDADAVRKMELREYWMDHAADPIDDFRFADE